jgi:hypothetical protein
MGESPFYQVLARLPLGLEEPLQGAGGTVFNREGGIIIGRPIVTRAEPASLPADRNSISRSTVREISGSADGTPGVLLKTADGTTVFYGGFLGSDGNMSAESLSFGPEGCCGRAGYGRGTLFLLTNAIRPSRM